MINISESHQNNTINDGSNPQLIKILVLSAGLNSAFHFIKTLKEKYTDDFYIAAADINDEYLISSYSYIDKFYKVPLSTDKNYYNIIIDICKKENINYILPTLDIDRNLFSSDNKDLIKLKVKSLSGVKKDYNKLQINDILAENGFLIPQKYDSKSLENNKKYFIKPIDGAGSVGAEILTKEQINAKKHLSKYIIQEICTAPEITLECFNYNNRISTAARERIEAKAGVCSKAKVYKSKALEDVAKKFIKVFNPGTYFNIQFMKNSKNEYVITDVNFRLAGAMGLTCAAGWDEASALANLMLNKSENEIFAPLKLKHSTQYVIRTYNNVVTKTAPTIAFDLDGTILNSFDRHKKVLTNALNNYGISINTEDYIQSKRDGLNNIKYLEKKGLDKNIIDKVQNFWLQNIEKEEFLKLDYLYENSEKLLNQLKQNSNLILITARNNEKSCKVQLKNLQLEKYFSEIYIVNSGAQTPKLKADILTDTLAQEMYGDTESDKKACEIAQIKFNPVSHGFRKIELLVQNTPPRAKSINNLIFINFNSFLTNKEAV